MTQDSRHSDRYPPDDRDRLRHLASRMSTHRRSQSSASRAVPPQGHRPRATATVTPPPPPPLRPPVISEPSPSQPVLENSNLPAWAQAIAQQRWLYRWQLWLTLGIIGCFGSGAFALALLFRLPGLPNCPAIFWPLASASMRFECARIAASKQTAKDFLEAIMLVDSLPSGHPLREEADRLVERWADDVLRLSEEIFNDGKLGDAIESARKIPSKTSAYRLVEERIKRWQAIWEKGETHYRKAEEHLRKLNWRMAFSQAVRLLDLDNRYWQRTKYDELNAKINTAREDGNKLGKAQRLADEGGLDNLLEAIKLASAITDKSYVHQAAQAAIPKFGRKMIELAQWRLERKDLQGALEVLNKVPESTQLIEEVRDLTILANAESQAWLNNIPAIEDAIAQAQRIDGKRPMYKKAQALISQWQQQITGLAQLEKARQLAQAGNGNSLTVAIREADSIPESNPQFSEAQKAAQEWEKQAKLNQDIPLIDQADLYASNGDISSLQTGIGLLKQVGRDSPVYEQAQGKIQEFLGKIQLLQDQPILDLADQQAASGDWKSAIATANGIKSGRPLHNQAQQRVQSWQAQVQTYQADYQAQRTFQKGQQLANSGQASSLVQAIATLDQVPLNSSVRSQADDLIDTVGWQLLSMAQNQSGVDLAAAISIAESIPSNTRAYPEAQRQIQTWKQSAAPARSR